MPEPATIMTPLKNTDKHFSDFLPPALVKDWRQCFRSRNALLLFILLELAGWLILFCLAPAADSTAVLYRYRMLELGANLYMLGLFSLVFVIPFRAGLTVAADTRVRSLNFLMLTPLSARRIVWGTWCSSALMVLLAALCALPLLGAYQVMLRTGQENVAFSLALVDWAAMQQMGLVLAWLVLCGWVMTAFYMFSAGLPRLLQLAALTACVLAALSFMGSLYALKHLFDYGQGDALAQLLPMSLYVVDALLLLLLFLELARRHYAALAENCSRSVRLLALLPWLPVAVLVAAAQQGALPVERAETQAIFALFYLYLALLADALLPVCSMSGCSGRLWRGLPAWWQKPGLASSALCLALATPFCLLPGFLGEWPAARTTQHLLYEAAQALNFGFSLLFWLLLTDCLCRRSAASRPALFALVALACYFTALCVKIPLEGWHEWEAFLPLAGNGVPYALCHSQAQSEALIACALNCGAFLITLLLLVCWRGRVKKA